MRKMTYKHTNALGTIGKLLQRYMRRDPTNELLEELQKDLKLLYEVRTFVQHTIANPTLPFSEKIKSSEYNLLIDGVREVG